jgi:hypothetical protein
MLVGQAMVGAVLSVTVTVNEQPGPLAVAQLTVVVPTANSEPDEGAQVTEPQSPETVGAG